MGMYPKAHVAYGYALGGANNGWLVEGLGEYGDLSRPWTEAVENEEVDDYDTSILRTLLLADGVPAEERMDFTMHPVGLTLRLRAAVPSSSPA